MSDISDRIEIRMQDMKLKHKDLVAGSGASKGTVSAWLNGTNAPTGDRLIRLAKTLKTTPEWLLTGEGLGTVDEQIQGFLEKTASPVLTTDIEINSKIWLPLMNVTFSCGEGESIEFNYDTTKKLLAFEPDFFAPRGVKPKDVKLMYAIGNSMEPYIFEDDIFAIDITDKDIKDGKIYAIYFEGEAMLKQIFKEAGGKLVLHSLNPKYRDKIVSEENGANFKVMGRQFWRAG